VKGKKDKDRYTKLRRSCQALSWCMGLMGFDVDNPDKVVEEMKQLLLKRAGIEEEYVVKCISDRDKVMRCTFWVEEAMLSVVGSGGEGLCEGGCYEGGVD